MTTDQKGYAKSSHLSVGTYYVKEIKAPANYVLSSMVYTLTVKADEVTALTVKDKGQKGRLTIYKKGQVLTGWDGMNFRYETGNLPGAEFRVTAGENIYCADGTKKYSKGDIVAKRLVTGVDGSVTLENLELGTYSVAEIKSPDGYKLNGNYLSYLFGYITESLQGVTFELYADEDIRNVDGTQIFYEKGELVAELVTDETGVASMEGLPLGKYYLTETGVCQYSCHFSFFIWKTMRLSRRLNLANREIIGYSAGKNKNATLVYDAFMKVEGNLKDIEIFHTDRGNEFKNKIIDEVLETFEIRRSLSKKGYPYDNAVAEAAFKVIKTEFAFDKNFQSLDELKMELFDYVNWYNNHRIHGSLNYKTPVECRTK